MDARLIALAIASVALMGCPHQEKRADTRQASAVVVAMPTTVAASDVTLTLDTQPVSAEITQGDAFSIMMSGSWLNAGSSPVYLQVSDSAANFIAPPPSLAPKLSIYRIELPLPTTTAAGPYTGTISVRACADNLCVQPYAGTTHSIDYTITIKAIGDWQTLQRTSQHDGYVPITINPSNYRVAWSWQNSSVGAFGPVITDNKNLFVVVPGSDGGSGSPPSLYARNQTDGAVQWRYTFPTTGYYGLDDPTIEDGVIYIAKSTQSGGMLYALGAGDGMVKYLSANFATQWYQLLNPTVHNGKVYMNVGYGAGEVSAFNTADGTAAWTSPGGTSQMNTPAVDDAFVYAYNGESLAVFNAGDGSLFKNIGPSSGGIGETYRGAPMLGSTDHVVTYKGNYGTYATGKNRQLVDYSVVNQSIRWMSNALYSNYPAVAKGVVYATSNETFTFDAIDEATGKVLWSWLPPEPWYNFIGNVVVTNNVAFVSTNTRIYAIDLHRRRTSWSAATPGSIAISANRMLFVSTPINMTNGPYYGVITAYRLN